MNLPGKAVEKLQRSLRAALYALGAESVLYQGSHRGDLVLMLHNVLPETRNDLNMRNLGTRDFEHLLKHLRKYYEVVSLSDLMLSQDDRSRIAITFDDGLINNLRHALPVLVEQNIPATIFISTSWLKGSNCLWPDELSMLLRKSGDSVVFQTETFRRSYRNQFRSVKSGEHLEHKLLLQPQEEIDAFLHTMKSDLSYEPVQDFRNEDAWRVMKGEEIKILSANPLIEIGSHSVSHRNLAILSEAELEYEMCESKKYLEQVTGNRIRFFAFPFGAYSDDVMRAASRAGYERTIGVFENRNATLHPDIRQRFGIYNDVSFTEVLHNIHLQFR